MKCSIKFCRNERAPRRTICHKCHSRQYKKNHPEAYYFNLLKQNAKRRGKEFLLSFKDFKKFSSDTGYIERKGKNGFNLSIDRIEAKKGYSIDNIQVLTLSENTSKRYKDNYPF